FGFIQEMPLACPVEFHALKAVRMTATSKRESSPGKPVASLNRQSPCVAGEGGWCGEPFNLIHLPRKAAGV
ncbi:MAG: hypothetical protein O3B01_23660, partial [Planctomycetota bacterium]|nr:hypothetical protein [Planctomycetota bacterium]